MKLYHFSIIFAIIAISLFVIADVNTNNFVAVAQEKEKLDQCFDKATDNAAYQLVENDGITGLKLNKEAAVQSFFLSMYASLGIIDDSQKQEEFKNYVPLIAVMGDDGYYLYYSDEYKGSDDPMGSNDQMGSNDHTYFSKHWSEKFPYYYEDADFIYAFTLTDTITLFDKNGLLNTKQEQTVFTLDYHELETNADYTYFRIQRPDSFLLEDESFNLVKKSNIISCIEDSMAYYCNKHNLIAQQCGIKYNFAMPIIDNSEWTRSIDNPCIIAMFQGYPFGTGADDTYNRFVIAGSRIKKNITYYLEQKDWYLLYHKNGCTELDKEGIIFLTEPYYTILDCVEEGAYACPTCNPTGVYAPEYFP